MAVNLLSCEVQHLSSHLNEELSLLEKERTELLGELAEVSEDVKKECATFDELRRDELRIEVQQLKEDVRRFKLQGEQLHYFEMTICNLARSHRNPLMAIGFQVSWYPAGQMPGYRRHSIAMHLEDGLIFTGESHHTKAALLPLIKKGDIIGAGIDFGQARVFWTLNGTLLESIRFNETLDLHAAVGINDPRDQLAFNFGQQPFAYAAKDAKGSINRMVNNLPSRIVYIEDDFLTVVSQGPAFVVSAIPMFVAEPYFDAGTRYYELDIIQVGDDGCMGIGWSVAGFVESNERVGQSQDSYCYESDGRKISGWSGFRCVYAPKFKEGDVVGCGLDLDRQETFFTLNGRYLGVAFTALRLLDDWNDDEDLEYHIAVHMPQGSSFRVRGKDELAYQPSYPMQAVSCDEFSVSENVKRNKDIFTYEAKKNDEDKKGEEKKGDQEEKGEEPRISQSTALQTVNEYGMVMGKYESSAILDSRASVDALGLGDIEMSNMTQNPLARNRSYSLFEPGAQGDKIFVLWEKAEQKAQSFAKTTKFKFCVRDVFRSVDDDFNGYLDYFETCCAMTCLVNVPLLQEEGVGIDTEFYRRKNLPLLCNLKEDLFPKRIDFRDVDQPQFFYMFHNFLKGCFVLQYSQSEENVKEFDAKFSARLDYLQRHFRDIKPASVSLEVVLYWVWRQIKIALMVVVLPFIMIVGWLQSIRDLGCAKSITRPGLLLGILWPFYTAIYYGVLVLPLLYRADTGGVRSGNIVNGVEVYLPPMLMFLVLFVTRQGGSGVVRRTQARVSQFLREHYGLHLGKRTEAKIAINEEIGRFKEAIFYVDVVFQKKVRRLGLKQLSVGTVIKTLIKKITPPPSCCSKTKTILSELIKIVFAALHCLIPTLFRTFGEGSTYDTCIGGILGIGDLNCTDLEVIIIFLNISVSFVGVYLLIDCLDTLIQQHLHYWRLFVMVSDLPDAKRATFKHNLEFFMDFDRPRNLQMWLTIRNLIKQRHQRDTWASSRVVGPILSIDIIFSLILFFTVLLSGTDKIFSMNNAVLLVDVIISFTYLLALLVVLVKLNTELSERHFKVLLQRKYNTVKRLIDIPSNVGNPRNERERSETDDKRLVLDAAITNVQNIDIRVRILGLVVDKAFVGSAFTAMATGGASAITKYSTLG